MRIKKIAPVTPANGNIENSYGTSQTDTYSQEYVNSKLDDVSYDSGWSLCEVATGFSARSGFAPRIRRYGKLVFISGSMLATGMSTTNENKALKIPSNLKPANNILGQINQCSFSTNNGIMYFGKWDDYIRFIPSTLNDFINFTICYLID